jgi:uncharacterized protein YxjI
MIKKILIGFVVFLTLFIATCISASCRARLKKKTVTEEVKKDSTVTRTGEELYRQEITIPGDSLKYNFKLTVGADGKIQPARVSTKSGRVAFTASVDSTNTISINLECQEYKQQVQMYKTLNDTYKLLIDKGTSQKVVEVPVNRIPFWIWMIIGVQTFIIILFLISKLFPKLFI